MKTRSSASTSSSSSSSSSIIGRPIKRQRRTRQQQQNERNNNSPHHDDKQDMGEEEEEESSSSQNNSNSNRNKRMKKKTRIDDDNMQNQNQNQKQDDDDDDDDDDHDHDHDHEQEQEDVPWYRILFTRGDEEYDRYMRTEWGFEKRGDVPLFEKLSLEGQQAGLSWLTILRKRNAYRKTFYGFDINKVAAMTQDDVQKILDTTPTSNSNSNSNNKNDIVVRHKGKIESIIHNARCIQQMRNQEQKRKQQEDDDDDDNYGVFDKFIWSFIDDKPIIKKKKKNDINTDNRKDIIANSTSPESYAMSNALKKQWGFKFVGPTTCYSMMQSIGMVIDHPFGSQEWKLAYERLKKRPNGYQYKD